MTPIEVVSGRDPLGHGLQVAVATWTSKSPPSREVLRTLHADRVGRRAISLIVAVWDDQRAWLFGPNVDGALIELPRGLARRVLQAVLEESDGLSARTRYAQASAAVATSRSAGVANQGLFATHYLATTAPTHPQWNSAQARAVAMLGLRHDSLITALGYTTERNASHAMLLKSGDAARGVAVLLEPSEQFDGAASRFDVSPVAWGLRVAARAEVAWLIMLRGSQLRLYPAKPGVGVGQKSQADTWFEIDLALVDENLSALLPLVFSADALAPGGSTQGFLEGSAQFAVDLGERLRDRVYEHAVPRLASAVAAKLPSLGLRVDAAGLDVAYRLCLRILFRLLFQAYAEDRGLLPYGRNARYDRNALKTWAGDLGDNPGQPFDRDSTAIWDDLTQVWRVIDSGDNAWNVPAYNGGLFGSDPALHPEGALLEQLRLGNDTMGPVLAALLVDQTAEGGVGAVDFRSLSVREFGTIYEGLLESALSITPIPLSAGVIKEKGKVREVYVPARAGDEVLVPPGGVYFHAKSGERKTTGTFFTPHIVVEHLLERTLEPVIVDHLARVRALLDAGDEAAAAESFFDLRVADLSMGSAHFLTAAIDRIEARMRDFLTEHPIPAITNELRALERAATVALGDDAASSEFEPAALLRRQIARRCIYGLDINPMAVELARLAIWISTFVPGLPMSSLDHTLVCANSLTGVGTVEEALATLDPTTKHGQTSLFGDAITEELAHARVLLVDVANSSEATKADVTSNAHAAARARGESERARLLFDAVVAARLGLLRPEAHVDPDDLVAEVQKPHVADAVAAVEPAHFPYLFPEVFLRSNPGFDAILGNPPWVKAKTEEDKWWGARFPGLLSKPQQEKNAEIARLREDRPDLVAQLEHEAQQAQSMKRLLGAGPYPGLTAGTDTDLFAAFCWRFLHETRARGAIGVVLPRTAFAGSAAEKWRKQLLSGGQVVDLTVIRNTGRWAFAMEARYTAGLLSYRPAVESRAVRLAGPYPSREAFSAGSADPAAGSVFPADEVASWSPGAVLPLLPSEESLPVFAQMRSHPNLNAPVGDWAFRAFRELHTTDNKAMFDFDLAAPAASHTLPVWTGRTFNLWSPGSGDPYAYADPTVIVAYLQDRRARSARSKDTAYTGLAAQELGDPMSLPLFQPRIAFRDVTRATDSRTMLCCLVPPGVALVEKSPYFLRVAGASVDEAYLLGILSSRVFDWYARRFVELKMSYGLLNAMPVPRVAVDHSLRRRVVEISGRFAAVDERYAAWAADVGVPVGSVTSAVEREALVSELDALVALLYGLSRDQVAHVFATFHAGWDFEPRLGAVLEHYAAWEAMA